MEKLIKTTLRYPFTPVKVAWIKKTDSLRKTKLPLQRSSVLPAPAPESPLFSLAEEQGSQEATPQPGPLKIPARLPWSQRWPFTGLGSPSPAAMWSLWRRCVLTWSEAWRKRISRWKDLFRCLPRLWEWLRGKLLTVKVLRLGTDSRWGSTRDSLTCTVLLKLSSRSLPSALSQKSRWKSPLPMPVTTFLINW